MKLDKYIFSTFIAAAALTWAVAVTFWTAVRKDSLQKTIIPMRWSTVKSTMSTR